MGPDGSLYLADAKHRVVHFVRRTPVSFQDSLPARAAWPSSAPPTIMLVVVTGGTATPAHHRQRRAGPQPLVDSRPARYRATFWGDLVAVAADTAVVLYETSAAAARHLDPHPAGTPGSGLQSRAGHRLYVAEDDDEVLVYDRFTLKELARIELPGDPPGASGWTPRAAGCWPAPPRPIRSGSWTSPPTGWRPPSPGDWAADLPLMAGASTLMVRLGDDVATCDLRQAPPRRCGFLPGRRTDLWMAAAWVPRDRCPAAVAAAESATVAQDSALVADSAVTPGSDSTEYLPPGQPLPEPRLGRPARRPAQGGRIPRLGAPARAARRGLPRGGRPLSHPGCWPKRAAKKLGRSYFIIREPPPRP